MTITIKRWSIVMAVFVTAVAALLIWCWMQAATHSYDQRFEACMKIKEAVLYPRGAYWPTDAYNEAMADCERKAGVPLPDHGNPGSWHF